ncbi:MAG: hypothetical protein K6F70_03945 [Eggerthellaceae bacterium]|nr:hypothetical protein [Eggerthellaceae bacterium]
MTSIKNKWIVLAFAIVCAFALMVPGLAFADNPSPSVTTDGGNGTTTQLNLVTDTSIDVTNNSSETNMKVLVPVAVNYVVNGSGSIQGPGATSLKNYSIFPVHVSDLTVTAGSGVTIDSSTATQADHVYLTLTGGTQTVSLGNFVGSTHAGTLTNGQWNIPAASGNTAGVLEVTFGGGNLGAFGTVITPLAETNNLGTVGWTVAAGTLSGN